MAEENEDLMAALAALPAQPDENARLDIGEDQLGHGSPLFEPLPTVDQPVEEALESQNPLPAEPVATGDPLDSIGPIEGESADPALAVEEMLASALANEEAYVATETGGVSESAVYFQLKSTSSLPEDFRPKIQAYAKELGLDFGADFWQSENLLFSQLTEYQAIQLRRFGLMHDVVFQGFTHTPPVAADEDDLALGDLASIVEPMNLLTEGAGSVALPKGEKEVLLLTQEGLAGYQVHETRGIVTAHCSLARRFFRDAEQIDKLREELLRLSKKELPASKLDQVFRELFLDLQKAALSKGANAVLGLQLHSFVESHHTDPVLEQMRLVAFGTAAVVDKL